MVAHVTQDDMASVAVDDFRATEAWFAALMRRRSVSRARYLASKRALDLSIVVITAPIWLAILFFCAVIIILGCPSASVFYTQERTGLNGKRFKMYKFRTMVPDADKRKETLWEQSTLQWPDFKLHKDPRVTKVGFWIRKFSLDEFPQIINVIKGDMALVGPRPTSFPVSRYEPWQRERLSVLPGITGLAQVINRDGLEFSERVKLDIAYVRNECLWLELLILFRTVMSIARGH
jgi:lipopolysaccharide/colanic/teichoic acid biosynthesis glycosyltransferase